MTPSRPTCERILRLSTFALTAAVFAGCSRVCRRPCLAHRACRDRLGRRKGAQRGGSRRGLSRDWLSRRGRAPRVLESAEGKAIDCIDFAAEPGVRAMAAEGYSLDQIRKLGELTDEAASLQPDRAESARGVRR